MIDIFLSYAREDLVKAKLLAAALEKQGWSVFWDRTSLLAGQDLDEVIEQAIEQAGCMIVAWSKASKKSDWVRGEANIGRERRILIPILFDSVDPPIAFRSLHTENFADWKGETDTPGYLALCKALTERIEPRIASAAGADKASHQSTNVPKNAKVRWSKPLTVKVGKIIVIAATLAILLWTVVPVLFTQKEDTIPVQAPNADLKVTNQPLIKEPEIQVPSVDPKVTSQPLIKEPEIQASSVDPKVTNQPLIKEPEMLRIPAGSFQMGSNNGGDDEKPVHPVKLKSFAIGRYEVTFDEYDQFAEALEKPKPDDSGSGRGHRPVINVNWEDAVAYALWLSTATGKNYHLPTEAQWEYAARAGTATDYYWDGLGEAKDFSWFSGNSGFKIHPVGEKKKNAFGLYDTAGNVIEWVQDCYEENYKQAPGNGSAWEAQNCPRRVLRGGSWLSKAEILRSADRGGGAPGGHNDLIGFRLAQD